MDTSRQYGNSKMQDLLNNESAKNEVIKLNLLNTGIYDMLLDIYPDLPEIHNIKELLNFNLFQKNVFKNFNSINESKLILLEISIAKFLN